MTLTDIATTAATLGTAYVAVAVLAHLLHLFGGVLSIGPAEVRRQVSEMVRIYGPLWYLVFVLTAGIYQRYDCSLEPEVTEYPGGDEL